MSTCAFFYGTLLHPKVLKRVIGNDGAHLKICPAVLLVKHQSYFLRTAIQLAKLSGFSPIVTTASLHNTDLLKSLGATHVVDRSASDVSAEIRKALGSSTTPLIYDTISLQDTQTQAWNLLAPGGSLILSLPSQVNNTAKGETRNVVEVAGNVHIPDNRPLGESLYSKLTSLLESGSIKV